MQTRHNYDPKNYYGGTENEVWSWDYSNDCKFFHYNKIPANTVEVNCGNGGDYEWMWDVANWRRYMKEVMNWEDEEYAIYGTRNQGGDKAWITFKDPKKLTFFCINAPRYASQALGNVI